MTDEEKKKNYGVKHSRGTAAETEFKLAQGLFTSMWALRHSPNVADAEEMATEALGAAARFMMAAKRDGILEVGDW